MNKKSIIITIISVLILTCIFAYARTTTTDLGLVKPTWTEDIDILDDINANSDIVEAFANDVLEYDLSPVLRAALDIATFDIEGVDATEFAYLNGVTSFGGTLIDDANATAARVTLELVIGSNVQAYDAGLLSIAGLTTLGGSILYTTALDSYAVVAPNTAAANKFFRMIGTGSAYQAPTWELLVAGDIPDISGTYQPLDTALTNISALTYVSPSFIKLTADDTYAVRTLTETKTDLDVDDLENLTNYIDSACIVAGGEITQGTTGTFTVAAITLAFLRASASATAHLTPVTLAIQSNQAITDPDKDYFVIFTYGSPCTITISETAPNGWNAIPIGKVGKDSANDVHYSSGGYRLSDGVRKLHERAATLRGRELAYGSTIAYSGTNNFTMTQAIAYGGINRKVQAAYNSATTTFTTIYWDGTSDWKEDNILIGSDIAIIDANGGNDSITQTAALFVTAGYVVGDELTISGSVADDGTYTILAVSAGTIEVATGSFTGEAAGEEITLTAAKYKIDFAHYDDMTGGTLADVGTAKYGVFWIYRHIGDEHVYVLYGRGSYSLAAAEAALEPTKPAHLSDFGYLVGNIIVPKVGGSFTTIQMVTDTFFTGTAVGNHANLSNLDYASSGHTGFAASGSNSDITSLTGLTTPLGAAYGGTGVANAAGETITLSGDDAITFTTSAATNVTLPTSGTLVNTAVATLSSLTSVGTITTGGLGTGAVLADVTMTLGSDADGDIYYRTSGKLTRLAKGTDGHFLKIGASIPEWAATGGGYTNLTEFVDQTAWRVFYSDTAGDVTELALGADGTYLMSNGAAVAPTFETPAGAGDMLKATYDADEDDEVDVAGGGTEKDTWTQYCIPYLSNTTVFGEIAVGTAEYALTVAAGATGYDWTLLMGEVKDDSTPELGGTLDHNNERATEVKTIEFNALYAIGNSGSTETVDWQNGAYQSITIDEACVISFSNEYVGTLNLEVTYGGTFALTFDGGVTLLEEGGVEIVTTDDTGVDILMFKNWGVADEYVMGALLDVKD